MALPYWYYKGRTTTPIDTAAEGPIVLEPRKKFHATQAEVSRLLRQKLVTRLPDPPAPKEQEVEEPKEAELSASKEQEAEESKEAELPAPKSETGSASTAGSAGSEGATENDDSSEPGSQADVITSPPGKDSPATEGEGTSSKPKEKEQESSRRRRSGQRRK